MTLQKAIFILYILLIISFSQAYAQVVISVNDSIASQKDTLHHTDSIAVSDSIILHPDTIVHNTSPARGYVITGIVKDLGTAEGIPFATVFFSHSPVGTAADENGRFEIKVDVLPKDTLCAQAMGYKMTSRILPNGQYTIDITIELDRASNMLDEVVVHASGVDPALLLLKHIIEHKPDNNPDKTENYSYEAYNKLEVDIERLTRSQFQKIPGLRQYAFIYDNIDSTTDDRPFLPVFMTETLSDYYFQRHPKKQREFIKASMVRGVENESVTKFLGTAYQNINSYSNYIPVFDKQFVSPISNAGAFYYKYAIKDTQKVHGRNIILVQFTPRRPGENCFYGDFWVVDSVYALQRISMEVPKVANVNFVNRVSLYQEFAPLEDSFWFCTKDKFIADFNAPYGAKVPGLIGRKTTLYEKIKINDTAIANVINDKKWRQDVIVDDSARQKTDAYWATARPEALSKNEKAVYKMIDTINQMPITTFYKNAIKLLVTGTRDIGPLQFGPYYYIYSRNSVEGNRFRLSLGSPESIKNMHFTGYAAYGTTDERFKYGFTGLWLLNRKPRMYLYGAYVHDIDHSTNYYDQIGSDNIFSNLFRKPGVPWKLAFSNDTRFEFYKEYFSGFSYQPIFHHREFTPFAPLPSTGIFTDASGNPTNTVINTEVGIRLRFAYKEKMLEGKYLRVSLGSRYPIVSLRADAGIKDFMGSGYNYQKLRFTVSNTVKIAPLGSVYYNLFTGKVFGTLPYPLLEIHPGNEYLYYNPRAFEMMNKYEFLSDEYAGFIMEHTIGGGIFNYIPVLKKAHLRQFWTAKGVIGSLSPQNQALNITPMNPYPFKTLQGDPYLELGTGISNILELFRIDFVWRVTPAPSPLEDRGRYFGIFGSVQFAF